MFYTLMKFLGWGLLLAFVGACVGWALRALKCRGDLAAAREESVDSDEIEALRRRVADHDAVVAERDRLRMQVADMRHVESPGIVSADADNAPAIATSGPGADTASASIADDRASGFVGIVDASETDDETDAVDTGDEGETDAGDDVGGGDGGDEAESDAVESFVAEAPPALDLDAAKAAIGKKIKLDDLTVVEGIGPKIAELCGGIGVISWQALADTPVVDLQSMLDDAGSRYQVHKPDTWPTQAGLLAAGRWVEFAAFTDELHGGK